MKEERFLTNAHESQRFETMRALRAGHDGKRDLFVDKPRAKPGVTYSQPELIKQRMIGIYERGYCECELCTNDSNHKTR